MNIKTITSTDGVNEVDFGSSASRFYWFQNIGTTTVHVSANADIVAGADGVAELAAGGATCIETTEGKVYVLGEGKVQIHNTGDKFRPFKNAPAAGGGEAVDAYTKSESDAKYAQKTDVIPYKMGMDIGTCATAEATITKIVSTLNKVAPTIGAIFAIKFVNAVPAQARLTVNGLSGYIQYRGEALKSGVINAGDIVAFMYYTSGGFNKFEIISIENGGNANSADTLTDWGTRTVTDANDAPFGFCAALDCENSPNTFWSTILTTGSSGATKYKTQIAFPWAFGADENRIRYRCENNGEWGDWQEISTTPIKSETMNVSTDSSGNAVIFETSENKKIISINCFAKQAVPFNYNNKQYGHFTENDGSPYSGSVSFTVYYIIEG